MYLKHIYHYRGLTLQVIVHQSVLININIHNVKIFPLHTPINHNIGIIMVNYHL